MAIGGSVVAYALYAFTLRGLSASSVGAFAYLQPILVAALAVLVANERVTVLDMLGGVFGLVGVYVAARPAARHVHRLAYHGA